MTRRRNNLWMGGLAAVLIAVLISAVGATGVAAQNTPFYGDFSQVLGVLVQDGIYSMRFAVFDAEWGGSRVWPSTWEYEEHPFVSVTGGQFGVVLGTGGYPTDQLPEAGTPLYVEVALCLPASYECPGFEPLPGRLPLLAASPLENVEEEYYEESETARSVESSPAWMLSGNAVAGMSTAFLGTTDLSPLVIRVGALEALRLFPHVESPIILGGSGGNTFVDGIAGGTICGGGTDERPNGLRSSFSAIVGGLGNEARGRISFIGGGLANIAFGQLATIAGGESNQAAGEASAIGGGSGNYAGESLTTIAGGSGNEASAPASSIGGGTQNVAGGTGAVVSGGELNEASGDWSGIGGGSDNCIGTCDSRLPYDSDGDFSFIAGGYQNRISGSFSFAAGHTGVIVGSYSSIGGGLGNYIARPYSFAAGLSCRVEGSSAVALGTMAHALHDGAFVWADSTQTPFVSTTDDQFSVRARNGVRLETNPEQGLEVSGKVKSSKGGFVFPDGTVQATSATLPRGIIVMWSGSSVPDGWALCDGTSGTPNLVDRFVMGARDMSVVGDLGGAASHTHEAEPHYHDLDNLTGSRVASRDETDPNTGRSVCAHSIEVRTYHAAVDKKFMYCLDHSHSLSVAESTSVEIRSAESLPPYYKLAFIMKL